MAIIENFFINGIEALKAKKHPFALAGVWPFDSDHQHLLMQTNRECVINWAKGVLDNPNVVFLDTETTGLNKYNDDEVVELTIVSNNGKVLLSQVFKPSRSIPRSASEVHGIWQKHVENLFPISGSWSQIANILSGKEIVSYNAKFDRGIMVSTSRIHNLKPTENYETPRWTCAMKIYSTYRNSMAWWKLEEALTDEKKAITVGSAHSAVIDTLAVYELVKVLAQQDADKFSLPPTDSIPESTIQAINRCMVRKEWLEMEFKVEGSFPELWVPKYVVPVALFQSEEGYFYMTALEKGCEKTYRLDRVRFKHIE